MFKNRSPFGCLVFVQVFNRPIFDTQTNFINTNWPRKALLSRLKRIGNISDWAYLFGMVTAKSPISLIQISGVQILIGHLKSLAGEERTWIHWFSCSTRCVGVPSSTSCCPHRDRSRALFFYSSDPVTYSSNRLPTVSKGQSWTMGHLMLVDVDSTKEETNLNDKQTKNLIKWITHRDIIRFIVIVRNIFSQFTHGRDTEWVLRVGRRWRDRNRWSGVVW
jgi:hypothetical protein